MPCLATSASSSPPVARTHRLGHALALIGVAAGLAACSPAGSRVDAPDGGPDTPEVEQPTLGPVRFSYQLAGVLNAQLTVCLQEQVRAHFGLAEDALVQPKGFGEVGYLVSGLIAADSTLTNFAAGRLVRGFEWLAPIPPEVACADVPQELIDQFGFPDSCFGTYTLEGEAVLGFAAAPDAAWSFTDEPGTSLRAYAEAPAIDNPVALLSQTRSTGWAEDAIDIAACAAALVEPLE